MRRFSRSLLNRLAAAVVLAALLPSLACCAQEEGFSCSYTPKSEHSSLFYIDIESSDAVSAAVLELSFDSAKAEYRSFSADSSDSVRVRTEKDRLTLAFACAAERKGRLCRLTFKALATGRCDFVLTVGASADGAPSMRKGQEPYTMTASLGEDVPASAGGSVSASERKSVSSSSRSGQRSVISGLNDTDHENESADDPDHSARVIDLRPGSAPTNIFLSVGVLLLLGAIGLTVFLLVRRRRNTAKDTLADAGEDMSDAGSGDHASALDDEDGVHDLDNEDDEALYNFLEDEYVSYPDEGAASEQQTMMEADDEILLSDLTADSETEDTDCPQGDKYDENL